MANVPKWSNHTRILWCDNCLSGEPYPSWRPLISTRCPSCDSIRRVNVRADLTESSQGYGQSYNSYGDVQSRPSSFSQAGPYQGSGQQHNNYGGSQSRRSSFSQAGPYQGSGQSYDNYGGNQSRRSSFSQAGPYQGSGQSYDDYGGNQSRQSSFPQAISYQGSGHTRQIGYGSGDQSRQQSSSHVGSSQALVLYGENTRDDGQIMPPPPRPERRESHSGSSNPAPPSNSGNQFGRPRSIGSTSNTRQPPTARTYTRYSPYQSRDRTTQPDIGTAEGAKSRSLRGNQGENLVIETDYCLFCNKRGHLYNYCPVDPEDETQMELLWVDFIPDFDWYQHLPSQRDWLRVKHRKPHYLRHLLDHVQMLIEDLKGFVEFFKKRNTLYLTLLNDHAAVINRIAGIRDDGRPQWESHCYYTMRTTSKLLKFISIDIKKLLKEQLMPLYDGNYYGPKKNPGTSDFIVEAAHLVSQLDPKAYEVYNRVTKSFQDDICAHCSSYIERMAKLEVDFKTKINRESWDPRAVWLHERLMDLPTVYLSVQFEQGSWLPSIRWPQIGTVDQIFAPPQGLQTVSQTPGPIIPVPEVISGPTIPVPQIAPASTSMVERCTSGMRQNMLITRDTQSIADSSIVSLTTETDYDSDHSTIRDGGEDRNMENSNIQEAETAQVQQNLESLGVSETTTLQTTDKAQDVNTDVTASDTRQTTENLDDINVDVNAGDTPQQPEDPADKAFWDGVFGADERGLPQDQAEKSGQTK